jgi:hypothetical protein
VRIPEHRIRSDATNDIAVRFIVRGGIGALVVERIVGDQVGELHRGRVLNVANAGIRIADRVVEAVIVRPANHVVVQRAHDLHVVSNRAADELAAAQQTRLFARKRREDNRRRLWMIGEQPRRFEQRGRAR